MQAKDVMTSSVVTVTLETNVAEIAKRLVTRGISAVPVIEDDGTVVGIVSEGDLMRRPESETERRPSWWLRLFPEPDEMARNYVKSHGRNAKEVMTRDVVTVSEDASLEEVATLLERHRIKRVPVTRDGKLIGIVSRANLLHGLVARQTAHAVSKGDQEIRAALAGAVVDTGVNSVFIDVVVANGIVHLWGAVASRAQKDALRVAAENTAGVKKVEDHVGILPSMVRAAMWVE